jgi:hypothetical protein
MSRPTEDRSRTALQWTIGALAAAPMISAANEIVRGANGVPGGSPEVSATMDGELRYANTFKFAVGPLLLSQLASIERSGLASFALGTVFLGGLTRLLAWAKRGRPHPAAVVAAGLEVAVVPLLLLWKSRIAARRP